MHKYQVLIGKRFIDGALSGLQHHDRVPFATWQAAEDYRVWASEHEREPVKPLKGFGSSAYVFDYAILEALGV